MFRRKAAKAIANQVFWPQHLPIRDALPQKHR